MVGADREVLGAEVTSHDCDDALTFLDDDAGFVQVMQGRLADPARFLKLMDLLMDVLHQTRPEIIGAIIAIEADGTFAETVAFRSGESAREGELKQIPAQIRQRWEDSMAQMQGDLAGPASPLVRQQGVTSHARESRSGSTKTGGTRESPVGLACRL